MCVHVCASVRVRAVRAQGGGKAQGEKLETCAAVFSLPGRAPQARSKRRDAPVLLSPGSHCICTFPLRKLT